MNFFTPFQIRHLWRVTAMLSIIMAINSYSQAQYCQPSITTGSTNITIQKFEFDSINDTITTHGAPWFRHDTTISTSIYTDQSYTARFYTGSWNTANTVAIFFDFNSDGDFNDAGEKIGEKANLGRYALDSFTVNIPCSANEGMTRIRIRIGWNVTNLNACGNIQFGETHDYRVYVRQKKMQIGSLIPDQPNTNNVTIGAKRQEIMKIPIRVDGCSDTVRITKFAFNANGTSDTADITGVRLYYTGSTNLFDTTNLYGTTSGGLNRFSVSGSIDLFKGWHYFWVAYDISSSASAYDYVDIELENLETNTGNVNPSSNSAPNGSRMINYAMSLSTLEGVQYNFDAAKRSGERLEMIGAQVEMTSGGSATLSRIAFSTKGSSNPSADLISAHAYLTGANGYYDTTYRFGSQINNPNGSVIFSGNYSLSPGYNFFWMGYDVTAGAIWGDTLDATLDSVEIGGVWYSPNTSAPYGERPVLGTYCSPGHPACGTTYINSLTFGTISNLSSGCSSYSGDAFTDYARGAYSGVFNKGNTYRMTIANSNQNQTFSFWLDANQNGAFDNSEWIQLHSGANLAANGTLTRDIVIPCTAKSGWTKIRIRSRGAGPGASNGAGDACTTFGSGETEEYTIYVSDYLIHPVTATQPTTLDVARSWTNQQVLRIPMILSTCSIPYSFTRFEFNSGNTTDTLDIASAKLYYTGVVDTFSTTTLFGSLNNPGGNYAITGTQSVNNDTAFFWLVFDIKSTATLGNDVDAVLKNFTASGKTYTPTDGNPSGVRKIAASMTYQSSTSTHPVTSFVNSGSTANVILRIGVNMSTGSSVNLQEVHLTTTGSSNPLSDIQAVRLFYTGTSTNLDTTTATRFGGNILNPNVNMSFTGALGLVPGNNYLWLVYDIKVNAIGGNYVDATVRSLMIDSIYDTPNVTAPSGNRQIVKVYCTPQFTQNCGNNYINGVEFVNIKNLNSGCTSGTAFKYTSYTQQQHFTQVIKGTRNKFKFYNSSGAQTAGVWIDYDQNGTYDGTEFVANWNSIAGNAADSAYFVIPCTAKKGLTRMRVRSRVTGAALNNTDACVTFGSGEAEDYLIELIDNPSTGILGSDRTICAGSSINFSPGGGYSTYVWSTGDSSGTISVSKAGTYWVTYTGPAVCGGTDSIDIAVDSPSVYLGNDTSICPGSPVNYDAGAGFASYRWSHGDTTQNVTISTPGTYVVVVTTAFGCVASDTVIVNSTAPVVNLGNDQVICAGTNTLLDAGAGFVKYLWNNGDTTSTINANATGDYSVIVTDVNGCFGYDTVNVRVSQATVNVGADITVCAGTPVTLNAGSNMSKYVWNTGDTTQTIMPTQSGTYVVEVTNADGCSAKDTVQVTFNPNPIVKLGNDTTICQGSSITLDAGPGYATYLWNNGSTQRTVVIAGQGMMAVKVVDANGCIGTDTININISSVALNLGPDLKFCPEDQDTIWGPVGFAYKWQDNSTARFIVPKMTGKYSLTITNGFGCQANDEVDVTVYPVPNASFNIKYNGNSSYTFQPKGTGLLNYLWEFGDGNFSAQPTPTYVYATQGAYWVKLKVTSINGCESKDSVQINVGTATEMVNAPTWEVFPNPFTHQTDIKVVMNSRGMLGLDLLDANGKTVWNKNSVMAEEGILTIPLQVDLSPGIYVLRLQTSNGIFTRRIIKQ